MGFAKECEGRRYPWKDQKGLFGAGRWVGLQSMEENLRARGDCEGSLNLLLDVR